LSPGSWIPDSQIQRTFAFMKHILLSCACLAALAAAAPSRLAPPSAPAPPNTQNAEAAPPKTMDDVAPVIKPAVIVNAEPVIRQGAKRQLVRYGPFVLPAAKV
jgi:hypothetical protein